MRTARRRFFKSVGSQIVSGIAASLLIREATSAAGKTAVEKPIVPVPLRREQASNAVRVTRDPAANMDPYNKDMQWYSMFKLNDGRILIAGGGYHSQGPPPGGTAINSVRAYDPVKHTWVELQPNDFGQTRWQSSDNKMQWFVPSWGTDGLLIYGNNGMLDIGTNSWIAGAGGWGPDAKPPLVTTLIDVQGGNPDILNVGLNAASEWCQALDAGIQTQCAEAGNSPGPDHLWRWLEYNSDYPAKSTKPLRLVAFEPPSIFTAPDFYPGDTQGFGGWIGCRNFSAIVGEHFYVGGGFVWSANQLDRNRLNKRFFRIHLPALRAAHNDAEKVAAVTELAPCPVGTYYPALSYDEARRKMLLFAAEKIFSYDVAANAWSDVTPTSQVGTYPNYDGWSAFPIAGWMAIYDNATDAHYVREGSSSANDARFADYDRNSLYRFAGRMRKVQFVGPPPSRYEILQQGGGQPFNTPESGVKHIALAYDPVADELIQAGGDYFSRRWPQPATSAHPGPNPDYVSAGGKRDFWMCKPKGDGAVLNWQNVQPCFMPWGQNQGPSGPDQVWWFQRTASTPPEWWIMPGAYRGFQYEESYGMLPELWGDRFSPFKWLRPGWEPNTSSKQKKYISYVKDPAREVGISTTEPDKFCAYDPVTDAAYCINDNFEIIKFSFATMDWSVTRLGSPSADDDGLDFPQSRELSIGGSLVARVDRRIYALCGWFQFVNGPTRSYLAWYDIDSGNRGLIRLPFDIEPRYFVANIQPPENFGVRNPEESTGLVAMHRKLVMIRTYDTFPAGTPCIWTYDVDRQAFREEQPAPQRIWGRSWVALPNLDKVMFFGTADAPDEASRNVFTYRIV